MRCFAVLALVLAGCQARPALRPVAPPVNVGVGAAPGPSVAVVPADEKLIVPCTEAEAQAAQPSYDSLQTKAWQLKAADPVGPFVEELSTLLGTPCFLLAREDEARPLKFDSGESLKEWWMHGGDAWLRNYLPATSVTLPPTVRTTLTLENGPPLLKPLLCPLKALDDHSCGTETAGWRVRAESAQQHITSSGSRDRWCEDRAREDTSGATKYAVYRACLDDSATMDVLPLGAFQAPKDGWLILSHTVFIARQGCQHPLAFYDLASGSAYLFDCRNDVVPARLRIGRVPTGALREAAWAMMMHHTSEPIRRYSEHYPVPKAFPIARRPNEKVGSRMVSISTSDAPGILWAWVRPSAGGLKGAMSEHLYSADNDQASHAYHLMHIADAAFQEGCAPLSAPRNVPWNNLGERIDAEHVRPDDPPLFDWIVDAKDAIAKSPPAKPGCAMVP